MRRAITARPLSRSTPRTPLSGAPAADWWMRSRVSQARFVCTGCGYRDNADVNAAKNILAAGLAVTGRGGPAVGRPAKRQPPERLAA
ncbi:zinc ribbon domain-containing protein [Pilimelia columellifera]|uniref:zinc ribbon domain-containing protein n=1 Tax=Pilimelia columellifera TaxID=706574 RepID=UPI003CD0681B